MGVDGVRVRTVEGMQGTTEVSESPWSTSTPGGGQFTTVAPKDLLDGLYDVLATVIQDQFQYRPFHLREHLREEFYISM